MTKRIACIGSLETPQPVLEWMEETGAALVRAGYTIVSGNAPGADQAWARGGTRQDARCVELCLPWEYFEEHAIGRSPVRIVHSSELAHQKFYDAVKETHPAFGRLSSAALQLHARNAMIVNGAHLVLGYLNPDKPGGGGTGNTFRIAQRWGIQTLNVADALIRGGIDQRIARGQDIKAPTFDLAGVKKW